MILANLSVYTLLTTMIFISLCIEGCLDIWIYALIGPLAGPQRELEDCYHFDNIVPTSFHCDQSAADCELKVQDYCSNSICLLHFCVG